MASNLPRVIPCHQTVNHDVGQSHLVCEQWVWPSGCGLVEIGRWRVQRCVLRWTRRGRGVGGTCTSRCHVSGIANSHTLYSGMNIRQCNVSYSYSGESMLLENIIYISLQKPVVVLTNRCGYLMMR